MPPCMYKLQAMEIDPDGSTLYAKRSLCWLHMSEESKALDDAYTYRTMKIDLSNSCHEQAVALILVKVSWGIGILFSVPCRIPWPHTDACLFRSMPKHAEHSYQHWNWTLEVTIWIEIWPQKCVKRWRGRRTNLVTSSLCFSSLSPSVCLLGLLMAGCCFNMLFDRYMSSQ